MLKRALTACVTGGALLLGLSAAQVPRAQAHVVKLDRNRFQPSQLRVHPGDTVQFVNGEGGPHNVEFDKDSIAPAERRVIEGAMGPEKILPLSGPIMMLNGQVYTFVVPDLPVGRYAYLCSPHWANMRGALIVER